MSGIRLFVHGVTRCLSPFGSTVLLYPLLSPPLLLLMHHYNFIHLHTFLTCHSFEDVYTGNGPAERGTGSLLLYFVLLLSQSCHRRPSDDITIDMLFLIYHSLLFDPLIC